MTFRQATSADIAAMIELERTSPTAAHWTARDYESVFSEGPPRLAQVIEEEGRVVAFLVAQCIGKEWEIENVVVKESERRRGLGSELVSRLLEQARDAGVEALLLEVRASNRVARALYEKWSFAENGRRPAYYTDPVEDAILYRLSLPLLPRK